MAYDIQARYDEFNARFFEGRLPKIPLSFARLKGMAGVVSFRATDRNMKLVDGSVSLRLSTAFHRSDSHLDNILIHEMVHVWFICVEGRLKENHGFRFRNKCREISIQYGEKIIITDNIDDLEPNIQRPETFVVILYQKDGKTAFNLISPNTAVRLNRTIRNYADRSVRQGHAVTAYTIHTEMWTKVSRIHAVQRTIDRVFTKIKPEWLNDLKENGRIRFSVAPVE